MKRLPLRYWIALATFLPLIFFALLAIGVGAYAMRAIPRDLVLRRQTALAQVAAASVAGSIRGYVHLLETTSTELARHDGSLAQQQQILAERAGMFSPFRGVGLLDATGTVIAVTPDSGLEPALGLNASYQPYFQEVKVTGAPAFSGVSPLQPDQEVGVVIAVPVRRGGTFGGVLMGQFTLNRPEWARDLNLLRTPQGGKAYLVDSTSTIIYHPDAARIGTNIQSDPALWRMVLAGQPQSMLHRSSDSGEQVIVTYAPIPGVPWGLITEEPWEAIVAPLVPYQWTVTGLLGLGIVVTMVVLVFSIRRVTRPINALVAAGQQVAEGQPYEPLAIAGPPDLRTLIAVINRMVARLTEQQAALRQYALQVLQGQEDERLRISHELHDETVQDLVALTQRIELSVDSLDEDPAIAKDRLREVADLAQKALVEVRRISYNLRPFALEDLGLAPALQALARELGQQLPRTQVHCEVVGRETRLPHELELTVFRIAQEALNNIRRHAKTATQVNLALIFEDWGVMLMVEDNGVGFELADRETLMSAGHLGLTGMIERSQLFGGELNIASEPGEGTTISFRLPSVAGTDLVS